MNETEFQELMRHAPELRPFFQRVVDAKHNRVFWRRIANQDPKLRSKALLESQLTLAQTAHKSYGKKGFSRKGVPIVAANVEKALKGKKFTLPKWKRVMLELKESLKEMREAVPVRA